MPHRCICELWLGVAQTILSLPINLPEELENALKPYFNEGNRDIIEIDASLHKKLFDAEESESVVGSIESSPPHSLILSPIAPPNQCDLSSRFLSPFQLGDCNLSPIGVDMLEDDDDECKPRSRERNFSSYMSVDSSLNFVPDVADQMPINESVNFGELLSFHFRSIVKFLCEFTDWYKHRLFRLLNSEI